MFTTWDHNYTCQITNVSGVEVFRASKRVKASAVWGVCIGYCLLYTGDATLDLFIPVSAVVFVVSPYQPHPTYVHPQHGGNI